MPTAASSLAVVASREVLTSGGRKIKVTLSWVAASNSGSPPDYYQLGVRVAGSGAAFGSAGSADGSATSKEFGYELTPGTSYEFRVRALWGVTTADGTLTATTSAAASRATLTGPSGVAVSGETTDGATVTWADNAANEVGYLLELRQSGGVAVTQYFLPGNAVSKALTGLAAGIDYEVRVAAYNSDYLGQYFSSFTSWEPFSTVAADIEGEVPPSIRTGKTVRINFNYDPDVVDTWTLTGDTNSYSSVTRTSDHTAYIIVRYDAVGAYSLLLTAQVGAVAYERRIELEAVSEPVVVTNYPYYGGYYGSNQFTKAANEVLDVRFLAVPPADEWIADEVPAGFSFDTSTGRLVGSPFRVVNLPLTLRGRNDVGIGDPVTFYLNFTAVADMPDSRAPWLPWLHADNPTLIDLVMDVRSRNVRSYYAEDGSIPLAQFETLSFAVLVKDGDEIMADVAAVALEIFPLNDLEGESLISLSATSGEAVTVTPGGTYLLVEGECVGDGIESRFAALNAPVNGAPETLSLACSAQLSVTLGDGSVRKSGVFPVKIAQSFSP